MVQIAVIGDIHLQFDATDVAYFNQSDDDLLLCVGDLGTILRRGDTAVADSLSQLQKPVLFIPGNHDTVTAWQLLAEIWHLGWFARLTAVGQAGRVARLQRRLGRVQWCGYSTHPFVIHDFDFAVIAARPFSMGGPWLSFHPYLQRQYGVNSLAASAALLKAQIDATPSDNLIFLAHNGPSGLGSTQEAIWGCDFRPEAGDFGDPDLQEAIAYARTSGKRVLAVVAGHMHRTLKGGGVRDWLVQKDDTIYVNGACVPRIFTQNEQFVRHHLQLLVSHEGVTVRDMII
ncbi:MAG: metallophosphoesterase [Anaerolineales bacterium]|nr:metallophosphoesterase [Anaerolineales bacterium]